VLDWRPRMSECPRRFPVSVTCLVPLARGSQPELVADVCFDRIIGTELCNRACQELRRSHSPKGIARVWTARLAR
jgi:hypothetical protein